jgi:serine acetyltransferase
MKCYFDYLDPQNMVIEDNVGISYGVYFSCHGKKQGHNKIIIRNDAHIGFRSSILARSNIEIGERAMVGAMSFVNKSVPADTTVAGVPAKIIKNEGYCSKGFKNTI